MIVYALYYYNYYSLYVGQETNILSIFCMWHKWIIDNKDDFDFCCLMCIK